MKTPKEIVGEQSIINEISTGYQPPQPCGPADNLVMSEFNNGLTVKEFKKIVNEWSETNEETGEDCEVWVTTGRNLSSNVTLVLPLNKRSDSNGNWSADLLLEASAIK